VLIVIGHNNRTIKIIIYATTCPCLHLSPMSDGTGRNIEGYLWWQPISHEVFSLYPRWYLGKALNMGQKLVQPETLSFVYLTVCVVFWDSARWGCKRTHIQRNILVITKCIEFGFRITHIKVFSFNAILFCHITGVHNHVFMCWYVSLRTISIVNVFRVFNCE
jgi:hypothetical protein